MNGMIYQPRTRSSSKAASQWFLNFSLVLNLVSLTYLLGQGPDLTSQNIKKLPINSDHPLVLTAETFWSSWKVIIPRNLYVAPSDFFYLKNYVFISSGKLYRPAEQHINIKSKFQKSTIIYYIQQKARYWIIIGNNIKESKLISRSCWILWDFKYYTLIPTFIFLECSYEQRKQRVHISRCIIILGMKPILMGIH